MKTRLQYLIRVKIREEKRRQAEAAVYGGLPGVGCGAGGGRGAGGGPGGGGPGDAGEAIPAGPVDVDDLMSLLTRLIYSGNINESDRIRAIQQQRALIK